MSQIPPKLVRKPSTNASTPAIKSSVVAPPLRRPSEARRSFSESQRSDGLRSRVVTQVRTRFRKSSKKDKEKDAKDEKDEKDERDAKGTSELASAKSEVDALESQSRVSEWVSTDAVISEARSEADCASSFYSQQPVDAARRLSLDGAMSQTVPFNSNGTLLTSIATSRLSSVFTPTPSGTKTTARTSIFDSPSRQLMPNFDSTTAIKDCPSYTFRGTLSVACDSDNLHFAAEKHDIWASIELRGDVVNNLGVPLYAVGNGAPSLAVAIVIDNS
jgi:hypothetical protein